MRIARLVIILTAIVYLCFFASWGILSAPDNAYYANRLYAAEYTQNHYHIDQQPSVLYLDYGDAPYWLHANSSCRYIAPLMIARSRDDHNLSYLKEYQEEYQCIMQYQGQYIIMETDDPIADWFGENQTGRATIMQKIHRNYTLVYDSPSWRVMERKPEKCIGIDIAFLSQFGIPINCPVDIR